MRWTRKLVVDARLPVSVRTVESRPTAGVGRMLRSRRALARPEDPLHSADTRHHCETSGRGSVNNLRRVQLLGQIETNHWAVGFGSAGWRGVSSDHYRLGPQGRVLGAT